MKGCPQALDASGLPSSPLVGLGGPWHKPISCPPLCHIHMAGPRPRELGFHRAQLEGWSPGGAEPSSGTHWLCPPHPSGWLFLIRKMEFGVECMAPHVLRDPVCLVLSWHGCSLCQRGPDPWSICSHRP